MSSRRVAASAASSLVAHSSSVLASPQHLVRSQAKVAERRPKWLTTVDRIQELLAHLHWQPALRSGSPEFSLLVAVRLAAEGAAAAAVPARRSAVLRFGHTPER